MNGIAGTAQGLVLVVRVAGTAEVLGFNTA